MYILLCFCSVFFGESEILYDMAANILVPRAYDLLISGWIVGPGARFSKVPVTYRAR